MEKEDSGVARPQGGATQPAPTASKACVTKCQQFLRKEYWTAFEADWDLGRPVGYGFTEADAIADLQEQLAEMQP